MSASAILFCRNNPYSHTFDKRTLTLVTPVRIGRTRDPKKLQPRVDNAIFNCDVVSFNHAVLSYEDGKFYLQDTKSHGGTFLNNTRISKKEEESSKLEVFSRDVLQFGEYYMDVCRIPHPAVFVDLRLFSPNGIEAKQRWGPYFDAANQPSKTTSKMLNNNFGNITPPRDGSKNVQGVNLEKNSAYVANWLLSAKGSFQPAVSALAMAPPPQPTRRVGASKKSSTPEPKRKSTSHTLSSASQISLSSTTSFATVRTLRPMSANSSFYASSGSECTLLDLDDNDDIVYAPD